MADFEVNTAVRAVLEAHPGVKQELSGLVAAFSWIKRNLNCIDDKFKGEKASREHISGCCASLLRKIEMQEQAFFGAVRALALSSEPSVEDLVSLRDHCSNAVKNSATRCKITSWVASGNDKNAIYVTAGGSTSHSSTPTGSDDFNIRIGFKPFRGRRVAVLENHSTFQVHVEWAVLSTHSRRVSQRSSFAQDSIHAQNLGIHLGAKRSNAWPPTLCVSLPQSQFRQACATFRVRRCSTSQC